jgi:hypothetical protein
MQAAVEQKEAEWHRNGEQAALAIDLFIRTRRDFDSATPLSYACNVALIGRECRDRIRELLPLSGMSPRQVIERHAETHGRRFAVTLDGRSVKLLHLTPFQGDSTHRVYGSFRCSRCKHKWASAASWKDTWQGCKRCETRAYPFSQHQLEQRGKQDGEDSGDDYEYERRPHDMERCERCRARGRLCVPSMYYAMSS